MGEVYRARDTRLDRTVALKILAGTLSSVEHRISLEREGRAVAALNHPHICGLHDVSREREMPFLVMEYVQGETLASRLARGSLAPREVVRYAIQIGEALDHAHRQGVVHRDLKPANIMLTRTGVKVLDFGLATLRSVAPVLPMDRTPRFDEQPVSERALLGTVHYMAPERLEGRDADAASDLFSFGAVMYEMATGRRAFESGSPAGVMAAILQTDPPPPSSLVAALPPSLDWVIQKALSKTPESRWQAAGDVVEILRWIARTFEQAPADPRRRAAVPLAVAAIAVLGAAALTTTRWLREAPSTPPMMFSIHPPAAGGFTPTSSSVQSPQFSLSPDGRHLAFVASTGQEPSQLWVRDLDALNPQPVAGTQGAEYPFWSPDSGSIAFFSSGSLKRVDLSGGPVRVLAAAVHGRGGAWNRHGHIVFAPNTQGGLYIVPASGGAPALLTRIDANAGEASHRWPQFLPDDRRFIYFVQSTSPQGHGIYLGDVGGGPTQRLQKAAVSAAFAAPDRLLFVTDDALLASRFDLKSGRLTGEASQVVSPVAASSSFYGAFSASATGLLVYASGEATAELVWTAREGRRTGAALPPGQYTDFRLSPDDQQLAIAEVDPQTHRPDIRILDLVRGTKLRITYDAATDASPIWSSDGGRVVFRSNRSGVHDLFQRTANGSGQGELLFRSDHAKYPTDWTPDGATIVYHTYTSSTGADIWTLKADGTHPTPLIATTFDEMQGQISPDLRWLAYTSFETGHAEVYVRSLSNANRRWQISAGGGSDPRWRGDSRELFYISADSRLTAVPFEGAPAAPRALFAVRVTPPGLPYLSNYDVTADGQRFLVKTPVHDLSSAPIHVITDWTALTRR